MAQLNKLQQMKRLKQNLSTVWTNVKVLYSVWPNVCLNKCSESLYNFTSRPSVGLNVFVFFIKIPQETHLHKEEEKTKNLAKLHSDIFFFFLILWIFSHASVAAWPQKVLPSNKNIIPFRFHLIDIRHITLCSNSPSWVDAINKFQHYYCILK